MNKKYEKLFYIYIYNKLKLNEIEIYLEKNKIKQYNIDSKQSDLYNSKYFFLLNSGDIEDFSFEEKNKYKYYLSFEIEEIIGNEKLRNEVFNFLEATYKKYFFSNSESNYIYYGPSVFEYMAPSDAIAIGFMYNQFSIESEEMEELESTNNKEEIIIDILNKIQFEYAPKIQMKIAVIKYNEIALNQPFIRLS